MKQPALFVLVILLTTSMVVCAIFEISLEGRKKFQPNFAIASSEISAKNVYVFSFSNITGDDRISFKLSTDGGATFTSKTDLLNRTLSNSSDIEISSTNQNVVVSWSERNASIGDPLSTAHPGGGVTLGVILLQTPNQSINSVE